MDDELVFALLAPALSHPVSPLVDWWLSTRTPTTSARALESRAWWALWAPLVPSAFVIAALIGWALVEPVADIAAPRLLPLVALPFGVVWMRAALRALGAARRPRCGLAYTFGLIRPRVVIAPELTEGLDPAALQAAHAHEIAHAVRYDPLRILVARVGADLQWPSPGAARRLEAWLVALELARDEEARLSGTDGADLAAAILAAARLGRSNAAEHAPPCLYTRKDAGDALKNRIERLLAPVPPAPVAARYVIARRWLIGAALVAASVLGARFGEPIMRAVSMSP